MYVLYALFLAATDLTSVYRLTILSRTAWSRPVASWHRTMRPGVWAGFRTAAQGLDSTSTTTVRAREPARTLSTRALTGRTPYVYAGTYSVPHETKFLVDRSAQEFEGRARLVRSFVPNSQADTCGHGTHVAGTIGSRSYGVAKKTQLYGIKVLDYDRGSGKCLGSNSAIISGMEYVATDARQRNCPNGVVVNMSLGGSYSQALNDAADALTQEGFFVAVAAGNDNIDASNVSPASAQYVCTVGGTAKNDYRYSGSNYGSVVNILGPAVDVYSTLPGGGAVSRTIHRATAMV